VAEKHDFRGIQRKIPQKSDFALNQDSNPVPSGNTAADIAKKFEQNFQRKSDSAKNDFRRFSAAPIFAIFGFSGRQRLVPVGRPRCGLGNRVEMAQFRSPFLT
jgi:hypothetical protein